MTPSRENAGLDDDFFSVTLDCPPPDAEELDTGSCDPILERKMSLAVRARRRRFVVLVAATVGCAGLLILLAATMHPAAGAGRTSTGERPRAPAVTTR
jgi:hypothetical protein